MTLLLSTITVELYLILACIATIAFILCGVFEMRFMVSVLTTQANERGTSWWEILRGANAEREQQVPEEGPSCQSPTIHHHKKLSLTKHGRKHRIAIRYLLVGFL